MKIKTVSVYGIDEGIAGAKFAKSVDLEAVTSDVTKGIIACSKAVPGSGHDNWLNATTVFMDVTASIKWWVEFARYHFVSGIDDVPEFVTSQSTMHKIMDFALEGQCNPYVTDATIKNLESLREAYRADPSGENYLRVLYNVPVGFELTARMKTDYRQLKIMYNQRNDHRLEEWHIFCDWIISLPRFEELCLKA